MTLFKSLFTLAAVLGLVEATNFALFLANQPSDLGVFGGFSVILVSVFVFWWLIDLIWWRDDEEDDFDYDDPSDDAPL